MAACDRDDACKGFNLYAKARGKSAPPCELKLIACTGVDDLQRRPASTRFYAKVLRLGALGVTADDLQQYEQEMIKQKVAGLVKQLHVLQGQHNKSDGRAGWEPGARLSRAVFLQLGQDRFTHFIVQLKWFLLSWVYTRKYEPPHLKTDVLVFTQLVDEEHKGAVAVLEDLGCTREPRKSWDEPSRCRLHDYVPLKFRNPHHDRVANDLKGYGYGESTQIVAEYPDSAFQYDVILRSDLDAFMCPKWGGWVPERRDTMYVGKGGFIQGNEKHGLQTLKRLHHAAKRLGLPAPTVINPGTSWVGDGRLLIVAARLQSEVIRWLHRYEFVDFDKCCAGMTGWPNWHYKVLTLYGGYLAFNALGDGLKRIVMDIHEGTAGRGKWRGDNVMLTDIRHAHVLHGRGVFSKHDLADGVYDKVDLKTLDPRLLPEFCLLVVLQSIRMPDAVLRGLAANPALLVPTSPDVYSLDTVAAAMEYLGRGRAPPGLVLAFCGKTNKNQNCQPVFPPAGREKEAPLPAMYDRRKPNATACWDTDFLRWLPLMPPYTKSGEGLCEATQPAKPTK